METRDGLIQKLIATNHLNVLERRMFTASPIQFTEVLSAAHIHFSKERFLPNLIQSWERNRFSYEGFCLERDGDKFILHLQVVGAWLNVEHSSSESFSSLDLALRKYLQNEFNY